MGLMRGPELAWADPLFLFETYVPYDDIPDGIGDSKCR